MKSSSITLVTSEDRSVTSFDVRNYTEGVESEGLKDASQVAEGARPLGEPAIRTAGHMVGRTVGHRPNFVPFGGNFLGVI